MPRKKAPATPPAPPIPEYEPDYTQTVEIRGYQFIAFWVNVKQNEGQDAAAILQYLDHHRRQALYDIKHTRGYAAALKKENARGVLRAIIFYEKQLTAGHSN